MDTDWVTTGIYFLKGVHPQVPPIPPHAPPPPPMADTGTAATKDTGEVILAPSQTAASPVILGLSCQDEVRKEHVVVVMTGIEDEGVERGDEEEEEKPTEEDETWKMLLLERKGKEETLVWISMTPTEKPRSRAEQLVSTSSCVQSPWFSPLTRSTCLTAHRRASAGRTAPLWEHVRISQSTT